MKTGCLPRLSKVAAVSVRLFMMMIIRMIHNGCLHCPYQCNEKRPPHTIVKICVLHFKILLFDVCLLIFDCKKRLQYLNLLNHHTSTFVLKTVSSTDILHKSHQANQKCDKTFTFNESFILFISSPLTRLKTEKKFK